MTELFEIIELILDENSYGVDALSLVENPAMESLFVTLSKEEEEFKFKAIDKERRIVLGAVLIPNKMIFRNQGGSKFYAYFTPETVRQTSEKYLMTSNQNNTSIEHEFALAKDGASVVETWIKEDMDNDKSNLYGFKYPVGTWIASMKIHDDRVWDNFIKTGLVKGFSIEGQFNTKGGIKASKEEEQLKELISILTDENVTD